MAEAQFISGVPVGGVAAIGTRLASENQSLVDRAQANRLAQQAQRLEMARQTALLPVEIAQAQAKIVGARAAIKNATDNERLKAIGAAASTDAFKEFMGATMIAGWDDQARELGQLQAKYSYLGQIRDERGNQVYGDFLTSIDKARSNAVIRAKMDQELEAAQARTEAQREIAAMKSVTWEGKMLNMIEEARMTGDEDTASQLQQLLDRRKGKPAQELLDQPEVQDFGGRKFYRTVKGGEWKPLTQERAGGSRERILADLGKQWGVETNTTAKYENFVVGQVYTDAQGNRAKYVGDGKWENQ